jgi:hypothetical protein
MLATDDGYGQLFYQADGAGALVHHRSCHHLKPKPSETICGFLDRKPQSGTPRRSEPQ